MKPERNQSSNLFYPNLLFRNKQASAFDELIGSCENFDKAILNKKLLTIKKSKKKDNYNKNYINNETRYQLPVKINSNINLSPHNFHRNAISGLNILQQKYLSPLQTQVYSGDLNLKNTSSKIKLKTKNVKLMTNKKHEQSYQNSKQNKPISSEINIKDPSKPAFEPTSKQLENLLENLDKVVEKTDDHYNNPTNVFHDLLNKIKDPDQENDNVKENKDFKESKELKENKEVKDNQIEDKQEAKKKMFKKLFKKPKNANTLSINEKGLFGQLLKDQVASPNANNYFKKIKKKNMDNFLGFRLSEFTVNFLIQNNNNENKNTNTIKKVESPKAEGQQLFNPAEIKQSSKNLITKKKKVYEPSSSSSSDEEEIEEKSFVKKNKKLKSNSKNTKNKFMCCF